MVLILALYLPKLLSKASEISPRVTLLLAASILSAKRFLSLFLAASRISVKISSTLALSRSDFIISNLSICLRRTSVLSMSRISNSGCF